jgi:hypothetical protein
MKTPGLEASLAEHRLRRVEAFEAGLWTGMLLVSAVLALLLAAGP